ncbi:MAG TPA: amino acid permease [Candidatus Thermoplasmatota archaeon]|nr:amino acid permease [Candidatus Thermoplasmatota archaeon]
MPELRRDLGFVGMAAVAASMMLGTGIFFGPSLTAQEFPSTGMVLLLWTIGGIVALCGAWVFGRLAALHPFAGGPYVYVREAYGPWAAFLFAWTSFVIIAPSSMAVMASLFARHVAEVSPLSRAGLVLMTLWSLAATTFANAIGVKTGGRVQSLLTGLKIVLVSALIALLVGATGSDDAEPVTGGGRLSIAFVGILFAVGGWEYAVLASEEVRDPRKTIPRALLTGTAIVVALYLLVVLAYLLMLGADGVARSTALAPEAAERALAGTGRWVGLAVGISALGTLNAIVLLGPRATFAVARDGLLPPALARVSKRFGTPIVAILLQGLLTIVYYLTGAFATVAAYTVIGTGLFIILSAVVLPRLRKQAGLERRPIHRLEDLAAWLVAGVYAWFFVFLIIEDPATAAIGFGLIAFGIVPYLILRRLGFRPRQPRVQSANL